MPIPGLGIWQVPDGTACVNAVRWVLDLGYRHLDTAWVYGNEASVGRALRESSVPRDEVFITTKFDSGRTDPAAEAEQSLRRLGLDYVDLYLVHWPQGGPVWAWPGMQRSRERGLARSVGVSNFSAKDLAAVMAVGSIPPVVNQVQFSPISYRSPLLEACRRRDVQVEAYSPMGTGLHLNNGAVRQVARLVGRTPAQVLLRWCVQRGLVVIPKSTHEERIRENAQIFDFTLSPQDMAELDALDRTKGTDRAYERNVWRGGLRRIRAIMPIPRTS
jgi:2,5-diketo-D-gluconate reductase A